MDWSQCGSIRAKARRALDEQGRWRHDRNFPKMRNQEILLSALPILWFLKNLGKKTETTIQEVVLEAGERCMDLKSYFLRQKLPRAGPPCACGTKARKMPLAAARAGDTKRTMTPEPIHDHRNGNNSP